MLIVKDVNFEYKGGHRALSSVSLNLPSSGIVSIVGPNGSGKSTLLKCINKLLKAEGEILLDNRRVKDMSISEIARIIGYVPQSFNASFPITVFDMVLLGRKPYVGWSPSKNDIKVVSENIASLGLGEFVLRDVNELSGGEKQKVLIAMALSQEPKILLLDEPTSNLDIKHQIEVIYHIKKIVHDKGILALIAIHDLNLASQYSNHVVMMNKGKVFAEGKPNNVLTRENIRTAYQIDVAIHSHGEIQHIVPVFS